METKNLKITDAEDWFENNKRTFNGMNAGEFLDKADFLSFANELQSEYEHLKQVNKEMSEALDNASTSLDSCINATPTGAVRNLMTEANIRVKAAIEKTTIK